jgi:hypothetical protein
MHSKCWLESLKARDVGVGRRIIQKCILWIWYGGLNSSDL